MGQLVSLLCLLASANLDTLLLGMGWALSDRRLSPRAVAVIGLVTSAVTALSLAAGNCVTHWASPWLMQRGPGLLLMGMGAWSVLDWLRESGEALSAGQEEPPTTWRQTLTLALVLGGQQLRHRCGSRAGGIRPLAGRRAEPAPDLGNAAPGAAVRRLGAARRGGALGGAGRRAAADSSRRGGRRGRVGVHGSRFFRIQIWGQCSS